MIRTALALVCVLGLACGDDDGGDTDGGADGALCARACDDGMYCNGVEACEPGNAAADEDGCVAGTDPCMGTACDETTNMCSGECQDADGDGARAASCGGDDCDDTNPDRYPGNTEICDSGGLDEDCDPSTLGPDADGDGYVDDECCNQQGDGLLRCGLDCDDSSGDINPEIIDACGNGDQDCDGDLDEDPEFVFYRDFDGDGFGAEDMVDTVMACSVPSGYAIMPTDCNDMAGTISPSSPEICDSADPIVDENCDGSFNEGCGCTPVGLERPCGSATAMSGVGVCQPGIQRCETTPGGTEWSAACIDVVEPSSEVCNGLDDNCNGMDDDSPSFECVQGSDPISGTNACGRIGTRTCGPNCLYTTSDFSVTEDVTTCDYCDDGGAGLGDEIPFADQSVTIDWIQMGGINPPDYERLGDAFDFDGAIFYLESLGTGAASQYKRGAWYLADSQQVGYGTVVFEVEIRANGENSVIPESTGDGWAAVVVEESCAARLGGTGGNVGVPRDCNGFAMENRFYDVDDFTDPADTVVLRRLVATSTSDVNLGQITWTSSSRVDDRDVNVNQRLRYTLTPDRPDTPGNETSVSVEYRQFATYMQGPRCGFSGTPACGFSIRSGERYRFGITGATGGYTSDMWWDGRGIDTIVPSLRINGLCR